jgi:Leucine-rich repeat (LRR) protein
MSNNVIESIDRLAFMGKDRVKEIDISWNNITFIYPETFLFTPNLARLSLANNRLLALLNGLMFSGNSLKILDLSYCNIFRIEETTIQYGVSNLQELHLQHNKIMYFSSECFKSLTNLKILNIGYNNLYSIDIDMFDFLKELTELKLENNPIPCHCHLREIYLRCLEQKIKFENMTCEENSEKDHKIDWSIVLDNMKCNYEYEMQNMNATKDRDYNNKSDAEDSDELSTVTIIVIAILVVVAVIVVCACFLNTSHDCLGAIGCALICTECLR